MLRKLKTLLVLALTLGLLAACSSTAQTSTATPVTETPAPVTPTPTIPEAETTNSASHDLAEDYVWDEASETEIVLNGNTFSSEGEGVTLDGKNVVISAAGTYRLSGTLTDGQLTVDTADEETVRLIFDGVRISNSSSAGINVISAEKTIIILADDSVNSISDGATYVYATDEEDEPNAAIFSDDDLSISGNGTLSVEANYNDGIASKGGLVIADVNISVTSVDDGIRGKDYLVVRDGNLTLTTQGDALKSDNDEDATLGYILVENGTFNLSAGGDAVQAETDVLVSGGDFNIVSGGGSNAALGADDSAKGLKAPVSIVIDGGTFAIDAADDAVHSDTAIIINDGGFSLASGDDAVHADASLTINGGKLDILQSYEGLESSVITLNGGDISVVSSDDGINISSDVSRSNDYLYIHGGTIVVDAGGDGLDANGSITMTGGLVIVNGPTARNNGALDYDASFNISRGTLIAAGSSGMAQAPSTSSTQASLLLGLNAELAADTLIHIEASDGTNLLTFAPSKDYGSLVYSSPALLSGETYTIYTGGSSSASELDGLNGGDYIPGNEYASFTVSSSVTTVGNVGGRGRR